MSEIVFHNSGSNCLKPSQIDTDPSTWDNEWWSSCRKYLNTNTNTFQIAKYKYKYKYQFFHYIWNTNTMIHPLYFKNNYKYFPPIHPDFMVLSVLHWFIVKIISIMNYSTYHEFVAQSLHLIQHQSFNILSIKQHLSEQNTLPALLKSLSTGAGDAGHWNLYSKSICILHHSKYLFGQSIGQLQIQILSFLKT